MPACQEGVDLLNRNGRYVFFRDLKRGRFNRNMWRDTFGRILCWLDGGHVIRQEFENDEVFSSCMCCRKWLEQDGYKWRVKR